MDNFDFIIVSSYGTTEDLNSISEFPEQCVL